ncbi:uncharacterized protein G2W53_042724 [Senna tora]|uniref:Uncharacterized protein n=1 Tax=Senna tora TaxID=362788 RepID=A0A834VZ75_9FABA|nr:uncharacterized protein G2W53_042724 [Senna tora]
MAALTYEIDRSLSLLDSLPIDVVVILEKDLRGVDFMRACVN